MKELILKTLTDKEISIEVKEDFLSWVYKYDLFEIEGTGQKVYADAKNVFYIRRRRYT